MKEFIFFHRLIIPFLLTLIIHLIVFCSFVVLEYVSFHVDVKLVLSIHVEPDRLVRVHVWHQAGSFLSFNEALAPLYLKIDDVALVSGLL